MLTSRSYIFQCALIFTVSSPLITIGQTTIDLFQKKINNRNLKFEVAVVGVTRLLDSNKIILPKYLAVVQSMNVKIELSRFSIDTVVKTLISLLEDSTKDWYANVLLYQITDRDAGPLIIIATREEWIKTHRERDLIYWRNYVDK